MAEAKSGQICIFAWTGPLDVRLNLRLLQSPQPFRRLVILCWSRSGDAAGPFGQKGPAVSRFSRKGQAKYVDPQPVELVSELVSELTSLSVVYHKPGKRLVP